MTLPVVIRGRVADGLNESCLFTNLPWVRQQFIEKLGIDPFPGTLNLEVVEEDAGKFSSLKQSPGVDIVPADGFCPARCFPVTVCGRVKGAIVLPLVGDYPASKLEIISTEKVREVLSLKVGDMVTVEIL
ncbi:MAG: CTP-dependent riboflavin kinase [Chloroflexi bacterium]|nr:CTP-dependent riboflavin kinase [Chloroflexota bacterium]